MNKLSSIKISNLLFNLFLFIFFTLTGVNFISMGLKSINTFNMFTKLEEDGTIHKGIVIEKPKKDIRGVDMADSFAYFIKYSFNTLDKNEQFINQVEVRKEIFDQYSLGLPINIKYLPENPIYSDLINGDEAKLHNYQMYFQIIIGIICIIFVPIIYTIKIIKYIKSYKVNPIIT